MIEHIHKTKGYSRKFLRTKTEEELEGFIHLLSLREMYGKK